MQTQSKAQQTHETGQLGTVATERFKSPLSCGRHQRKDPGRWRRADPASFSSLQPVSEEPLLLEDGAAGGRAVPPLLQPVGGSGPTGGCSPYREPLRGGSREASVDAQAKAWLDPLPANCEPWGSSHGLKAGTKARTTVEGKAGCPAKLSKRSHQIQ